MEIGIIITARVKSTRCPEKVLQLINGKRAIEILLDHVDNPKYRVILAIPDDEENNILAEIAQEKGVQIFRGFNDSPLHRLYAAARENDFDIVVRVTADDILIDSWVLADQIKFHLRGGNEYTYCKRIPEGTAAEVINTDVLRQVIDEVGEKPVEFISYYIKNKFKTMEYYPRPEYQQSFRLTLDYEEDLMLLRILFASLPDQFGTLDFINFLKQHKYFTQINRLPTVTVYTCNYNTAQYIVECMKSVLDSTYQDFEYIVIDDKSTDDSMNVIAEFYSSLSLHDQKRVRILRNEKNIGLSASSNKALGMARGKYIIRIDSDDTIREDLLECQIWEIKKSECDAVITGYKVCDESLSELEIINKNMWHPGCALISKWCANELKYREELEFMEGRDFWNRFRKEYAVSFLPDAMWNYRRRPGQKTQDKNHPENIRTEKLKRITEEEYMEGVK
jgi:spore coat polysaccharide biosynthesis protein SpsF